MIRNKKQMLVVIGVFTLVMLLGTVTYAFFNYTRTGSVNNIRTGRIYFNTSQDEPLNITNAFPIKSEELSTANLDTMSILIEGDTTYVDGEEFKITFTSINNRVGGKIIPINYIATYTANANKTIGTSSNDYFNARELKTDSIYSLRSEGRVLEGNQILVGYVDNEDSGISGTLTIKAYISNDNVAISDTYPESGPGYVYNTNRTNADIANCVTYLSNDSFFQSGLQEGENINDFCAGTGTIRGYTLNRMVSTNNMDNTDILYLASINILIYNNYENGTTNEWVNGRVVLTTSEWNSFANVPISFKIKAESNEGIWVDEPGRIDTCQNCKFMHKNDVMMYTTWNTENKTPTMITSDYSENYYDIVETSGKEFFLGFVTNDNNQITNAYICGLYNGVTPFCFEVTSTGINSSEVMEQLNSSNLWNGACSMTSVNIGNGGEVIMCGNENDPLVVTTINIPPNSSMFALGEYGFINACAASHTGMFMCTDIGLM